MSSCFLSYAHEDSGFANKIFGLLTSLGVDCFVDQHSVSPGENWPEALGRGLTECEWFLLLVSTASLRSEWVKDEVAWALDNRRSKIILVAIDDTPPSKINMGLSRIQFIDFAEDGDTAQNSLIRLLVDSIYKPNRRSDCVEGKWRMQINQHDGPLGEPIEFSGELSIEAKNNNYEGAMKVAFPSNLIEILKLPFDYCRFTISGGFNYERFVSVNFFSANPGFIQFGTFILELHSVPDTMTGKYIAFGPITNRIISGEVYCFRE